MKDVSFNQFKDADGKGIYKDVEKVIFSASDHIDDFDEIDKDPLFMETQKQIDSLNAQLEELEAKDAINRIFSESDVDDLDVEGDAAVDEEGDVEVISTTPDEDLDDEVETPEIGTIHIDLPDDIDPADVSVNIDGTEYVVDDEDSPLEVNTGVEDLEAPNLSVDLPDGVDPSDVSVNIDGKEYIVDPDSYDSSEDAIEDEEIDDDLDEDVDDLNDDIDDIDDDVVDASEELEDEEDVDDELEEIFRQSATDRLLNKLIESDSEDVEDDDEDLESDEDEDVESGEDEEADEELEAAEDEAKEDEAEEDVDEEIEEMFRMRKANHLLDRFLESDADDADLEADEVEDEVEEDEDLEAAEDEEIEDEDVEESEDEDADEEIEEMFGLNKRYRRMRKFVESDADDEELEDEEVEDEEVEDEEVEDEESGEDLEGDEISDEEAEEIEETVKLINHHLCYKYGNKWKIYEGDSGEDVADDVEGDDELDSYDLTVAEETPEDDITVEEEDSVEESEPVEEVVASNGENSEDMDGEELTDVAEGVNAILDKYLGKTKTIKESKNNDIDNLLDSFLNEGDFLNYGPNAGMNTDLVGGPSWVRTGNPNHPTKTYADLDDSKYYGDRKNVKVAAGNSASRADMADVTENLYKAMAKSGTMRPNGRYTAEGTDPSFIIYVDDTNKAIKPLSEVSTHTNNLPFAENVTDWNAQKASNRIKEVAYKNETGADLRLMKATHLYYINEGKNPEDYQFPIATIIKGKVYAVPQAIQEAAKLFASPVYTKKFDDATLNQIRESIDFYMNKMGEETAWQNGTCVNINEATNLTMLTRKSVWNPYKVAEMEVLKDKERKAKKLLSE